MGYNWQFHIIADYWPVFVRGALVTLQITFLAALLGLAIGLPFGVMRESRSKTMKSIVSVYVEFIRATPAPG